MKKGFLVYLCFFAVAFNLPWAIKMAILDPSTTNIIALIVISACLLACSACVTLEIIDLIKNRKNGRGL